MAIGIFSQWPQLLQNRRIRFNLVVVAAWVPMMPPRFAQPFSAFAILCCVASDFEIALRAMQRSSNLALASAAAGLNCGNPCLSNSNRFSKGMLLASAPFDLHVND